MSETRKRLAIATICLSMIACSSGRETHPDQTTLLAPRLTPQNLSESASAAAEGWAQVDWSNPISVMTVPYAGCTIRPEGTSDSRNAQANASSDAVIRFYPPPSSWGTKLILDCAADGATPSSVTYSVDLSDPSTFFREASILAGPQVIGTRAALSGDLTAVPQQQLLLDGYPLRPPTTNPDAYAQWTSFVTTPTQILQVRGVFVIGFSGASTVRYDTTVASNAGNWSGQVMSPGGFNSVGTPQNGGVALTSYETEIKIPSTSACPGSYCFAYLWGGLGGFGSSDGNLFQSGYVIEQETGGVSQLFAEYTSFSGGSSSIAIPPNQLPSGALAAGQVIIAEGWGSSITGGLNPSAPYATFIFCGQTAAGQQWCAEGSGDPGAIYNSVGVTLKAPSTGSFVGLTSEAIVELPPSTFQQGLPNSSLIEFWPLAWDQNFNEYEVPGTPFIFLNMIDSSDNLMDYPFFNNDPNLPTSYPNTPPGLYNNDPWDLSNPSWYFYVKWYNWQ